MKILDAATALSGLFHRLYPLALEVYQKASDGEITADEGAEIARDLAAEAGDLRVTVRGRDILGDVAQAEIASGLGRVAVRLAHALRD